MGGRGIDQTTEFFMKLAAITLDIISFVPILGSVTDFVAATLFGIWFAHHGVSVMRKRPLGFIMTFVAEFIPFVEMLPFWSIFVWSTIKRDKVEQAQNGL